MAFTVTPTSGDAPYSLSATITNAANINGVNYVASVVTALSAGSCPLSGSGTPLSAGLVNSLVAGDTVALATSSVPSGSCRNFTLQITRLSDNVVVASSDATVNNV